MITDAADAASPVHPRVCGGSPGGLAGLAGFAGTSPRVRGKLRAGLARRREYRYIPACAGEAGGASAPDHTRQVHPRVCGGSSSVSYTVRPFAGTSPRVRGKPDDAVEREGFLRYIPACAGEARKWIGERAVNKVHPRVCGGSAVDRAIARGEPGTSPRVRGKLDDQGVWVATGRYIPACAGEANRGSARQPPDGVHPRVCGGSRNRVGVVWDKEGTSPRVRGKRAGDLRRVRRYGYIPACAGEAWICCSPATTPRVHPRVCGGSSRSLRDHRHAKGTSPRVRGKQRHVRGGILDPGYIPACAGEAVARLDGAIVAGVHPRVCGGSVRCLNDVHPESGTSPRVRGKRVDVRVIGRRARYIPACAGEACTARIAFRTAAVHPRVCGGSPRR